MATKRIHRQLDSMVGRVVTIETRHGWSVGRLDVTANYHGLGRRFHVQPVDGYQFYLRFMADEVDRIDEDEQRIILIERMGNMDREVKGYNGAIAELLRTFGTARALRIIRLIKLEAMERASLLNVHELNSATQDIRSKL